MFISTEEPRGAGRAPHPTVFVEQSALSSPPQAGRGRSTHPSRCTAGSYSAATCCPTSMKPPDCWRQSAA
jgi:hypothetical protein